ncbi:MAG: TldD/PmbA family protein [Vulcanimicrobiaceae bacterium]
MRSDAPRDADEARALAKRVMGLARGADQVQVSVDFRDQAYARFARNYVVQNLTTSRGDVRVTLVKGKHLATVTTSDLSEASLRKAVADARDIAARVPVNREFVSLAVPGAIGAVTGSAYAATRDASPDARIDKLLPVFARMERSRLASSGFTTTQTGARAVVNSLGVDATHTETYAGLEIKAIGRKTSGFAEFFSRDYAAVDAAERAERAASKATISNEPLDFPPGTYTVLLEPPAFVDCLNSLLAGMNVGSVLEEKTSWLIGRLDKPVFSPNFTLRDDWSHPLLANAPFASDGTPTQKLTLVERGIPRRYVSSTYLANKLHVANTGHDGYPINAIVAPGTKSREQLIAGIERGILISRTWYTRQVDPRECTITGLTRDGVFLIENGKLTKTLKNFRFFTSMIAALADIEVGNTLYLAESADTPTTLAVPDAKIAKFTLSAQTSFA